MSVHELVVGYDGSDASRRALSWALDEASIRHLPVLVLTSGYAISMGSHGYVTYVDPSVDDLRLAAEDLLAAAVATAKASHPDVEVRTRFVPGNPAPALIEELERLGAAVELTVLGTRGLGGFRELLLGSTSLQLAAHAPSPVVVVRASDDVKPGVEAGRVVLGVDGSPASNEAIAFAFEEAALRGVGLTALHAWDAPFFELPGKGGPVPERVVVDEFFGDELRTLAEALAGWREKYPDVDVRQVR